MVAYGYFGISCTADFGRNARSGYGAPMRHAWAAAPKGQPAPYAHGQVSHSLNDPEGVAAVDRLRRLIARICHLQVVWNLPS